MCSAERKPRAPVGDRFLTLAARIFPAHVSGVSCRPASHVRRSSVGDCGILTLSNLDPELLHGSGVESPLLLRWHLRRIRRFTDSAAAAFGCTASRTASRICSSRLISAQIRAGLHGRETNEPGVYWVFRRSRKGVQRGTVAITASSACVRDSLSAGRRVGRDASTRSRRTTSATSPRRDGDRYHLGRATGLDSEFGAQGLRHPCDDVLGNDYRFRHGFMRPLNSSSVSASSAAGSTARRGSRCLPRQRARFASSRCADR